MPVKPGIAKDLIEADDIGRKAVADFIDSLLVKKSVYHIPHGHCQLLIEFPPKLTNPNLRMACNHTLNPH